MILALMALLAACAPLDHRALIPTIWMPSPNFGERRPNMVIIHHTSNSDADDSLRTLRDPSRQVSAHYLIARDGRIFQLVDESKRAWHAGASYWGGMTDLNSVSIGIELDNAGEQPYPETQIEALIALLRDLRQRWEIPVANFLGHGDVAPGRKVDPGRSFPWRRLAAEGFGLWCDLAGVPIQDDRMALQSFGYDVSDLAAARGAFKRHFSPASPDESFTEIDRARLGCLVELKGQW